MLNQAEQGRIDLRQADSEQAGSGGSSSGSSSGGSGGSSSGGSSGSSSGGSSSGGKLCRRVEDDRMTRRRRGGDDSWSCEHIAQHAARKEDAATAHVVCAHAILAWPRGNEGRKACAWAPTSDMICGPEDGLSKSAGTMQKTQTARYVCRCVTVYVARESQCQTCDLAVPMWWPRSQGPRCGAANRYESQ